MEYETIQLLLLYCIFLLSQRQCRGWFYTSQKYYPPGPPETQTVKVWAKNFNKIIDSRIEGEYMLHNNYRVELRNAGARGMDCARSLIFVDE